MSEADTDCRPVRIALLRVIDMLQRVDFVLNARRTHELHKVKNSLNHQEKFLSYVSVLLLYEKNITAKAKKCAEELRGA
jgi:hypothetical protein